MFGQYRNIVWQYRTSPLVMFPKHKQYVFRKVLYRQKYYYVAAHHRKGVSITIPPHHRRGCFLVKVYRKSGDGAALSPWVLHHKSHFHLFKLWKPSLVNLAHLAIGNFEPRAFISPDLLRSNATSFLLDWNADLHSDESVNITRGILHILAAFQTSLMK